MKNLFFTLVFMLIGAFAFANNAKELAATSYENSLELVKSFESESLTEVKVLNYLEVLGTCYIGVRITKNEKILFEGTLVIYGVSSEAECRAIASML